MTTRKRGTLASYSTRAEIEKQSAAPMARDAVIREAASEWDAGGLQTRGISRGAFISAALRHESLPVLTASEAEPMGHTKLRTFDGRRWLYK